MLAQGDCYKSEEASAITEGAMDKNLRDVLQPDTAKKRNRNPGETGFAASISSDLAANRSA